MHTEVHTISVDTTSLTVFILTTKKLKDLMNKKVTQSKNLTYQVKMFFL